MKLTLKILVILYTSCKSEVTIGVTSNHHAAILRDAISRYHSYCSVTQCDISLSTVTSSCSYRTLLMQGSIIDQSAMGSADEEPAIFCDQWRVHPKLIVFGSRRIVSFFFQA